MPETFIFVALMSLNVALSPTNELAVIIPVVLIESVGPKVDVDTPLNPAPTPKAPLYTAPVM